MKKWIAILTLALGLIPTAPLLAISRFQLWELDSLFNVDPAPSLTQVNAREITENKADDNADQLLTEKPVMAEPAPDLMSGLFSGLDSLFGFGSLSAPAPVATAPVEAPIAPDYLTGLGDLFILDRLFQINSDGTPGSAAWTSLGDVFILDQLFGGGFLNSAGSLGLGDLFVLDRLFRPSSSLLNPSITTLGDLFILDQLFNY